MPRTKRDLYNSLRSEGLSQATFARLYKPVNTSEGVSVTPPLFATVNEVTRVARPLDAVVNEVSDNEVWDRKNRDNVANRYDFNTDRNGGVGSGAGVLDSLAKHGWDFNHRIPIGMQGAHADTFFGHKSVETTHPIIANAQHRIAAAKKLNPNQFVALSHVEGFADVFGDYRVDPNN